MWMTGVNFRFHSIGGESNLQEIDSAWAQTLAPGQVQTRQ